jgi:hypothetical protein
MAYVNYAPREPSADEGYDENGGKSITELRKQYLDWSSGKREEIEEQRIARHYYHGSHWSSEEIAILKKRKQPVITFNRVNRKIDGVVGTLKRLWQDPKAFARTPHHDQEAEIATEALRYALDRARWKAVGIEATRNGGREGIGCIQMVLEPGDQGDAEISLAVVDDDCFFYDPRSFRPDFSDARYMGVAKWLDLDVAQEMYPEHVEELSGLLSSGGDIESSAQQDRERRWIDVEQKRVRVIEHEYQKGSEWHCCHYSARVKLFSQPSPFVDDKGKSASSFLAFSAYVDHDGDRYGFVRNMKSPQDEINMRRSKALHQLNTRRLLVRKGAVENVERLRQEAMRPDGVLEFNIEGGISFEDAAKAQEWQGQMEMLAEAKSEIENYGPTLVEKGMEKSGRAIALLQQSGLAELGPFIDAWSDWKLRVYRAMWSNIRKFWTAERWIRVTDQQDAARFARVNTLAFDQMGQPQLVTEMYAQQAPGQQMQMVQQTPGAIGALDVDIILDEAPDSVTTMQDTFELLQSLASAGIPVPPSAVIEMSGLPASTKQRVMGMIEQAQQADPMAEQAKQVALEQEQSKTMSNKATALDKVASAASKWADIAQKPEQAMREQEQGDRDFQGRNVDRQMAGQRDQRNFEGRDQDRQMKIEDMRARQRQAAQQAALREQQAQQQAMNGGGAM